MTFLVWTLLVLSDLGLVAALVFLRQLEQATDELEEGLSALSRSVAQEQVRIERMLEVTTTSVEDMHRAVTDVSFDILEAIPKTREAGRRIRAVHDTYATNLYGSVRVLGKGLGLLRQRRTRTITTIEGQYRPVEKKRASESDQSETSEQTYLNHQGDKSD
ncbi:MAG: hypothetical protein ACQES2_09770 [Pseudomonadota bacterium]